MRSHLLLLPATLLALAALPSNAAVLTAASGELEFQISSLQALSGPSVSTPAILVSSGAGGFELPESVFQVDLSLPTQLFTGVTLISTLNIDATNAAGSFFAGGGQGGGFGGAAPLSGQAVIGVLSGLLNLAIPLSVVGAGGFTLAQTGGIRVEVTGHLWTTGPASVPDLTAFISNGGFINTVVLSGFDNRTAAHKGTLLLVSPLRVITAAAGTFPAFVTMSLTFVPEPSFLLLMGVAVCAAAVAVRSKD